MLVGFAVHGVKTDSDVVRFAAWVDNYYAFGSTLHNAIHIAESFEAELYNKWGLNSSRYIPPPITSSSRYDIPRKKAPTMASCTPSQIRYIH